jgi:MoaD family protein
LKVKIRYFAIIRELVGLREETLELKDKTTVLDALKVLAEKHGEQLKQYVFDSETGNPRPYLQFLVNQDSITKLNGFLTVLEDNYSMAIIPPVGGG